MMTLADAAAAAKVSRSTMLRSIRAGKVSATRDEAGAFMLDPAELARAFPIKPVVNDAPASEPAARHDGELARLQERVTGLEAMVHELRQARDDWRGQAQRLVLAGPEVSRNPQASPRRRWWLW